jgi:hypothetical protein
MNQMMLESKIEDSPGGAHRGGPQQEGSITIDHDLSGYG